MGGFNQPAGIVSLDSVNGTFVNGVNGTFAEGGYMVADSGVGVIKQVPIAWLCASIWFSSFNPSRLLLRSFLMAPR